MNFARTRSFLGDAPYSFARWTCCPRLEAAVKRRGFTGTNNWHRYRPRLDQAGATGPRRPFIWSRPRRGYTPRRPPECTLTTRGTFSASICDVWLQDAPGRATVARGSGAQSPSTVKRWHKNQGPARAYVLHGSPAPPRAQALRCHPFAAARGGGAVRPAVATDPPAPGPHPPGCPHQPT